METAPLTPAMDYADRDLSERIALYQLTGWRLLWRSTGPVWDAYMAGVTDGVTYRIIGTCDIVVRDTPVMGECSTGDARWRGRAIPDHALPFEPTPFQGPTRPTPGHYPHSRLPGRRYGRARNGRDALPVPSCWYAPWSDVYPLARTLDES